MSELKLEQIGHPDAVSNSLTFDSDGTLATTTGFSSGGLKVKSSSGGTFSINPPSSASDRTLVLPDEAGTVLTSATNIVTNYGPLFRAARGPTSNQTVSHNTLTKVQFDVDVVDTDNCYDNTTNYRFTPTVAGYYFLTTSLVVDPNGTNFTGTPKIHKNGTRQIQGEYSTGSIGSGQNQTYTLSLIAEANGTTDYFEVYFYFYDFSSASTSSVLGGADYRNSNFQGYLVRAL